jgi:hypothetical protein
VSPAAADAGAAAQLVAFGLTPRVRPAGDAAYAELVARFSADAAFAAIVDRVAGGLGLAILDVGASGIVLAPGPDSPFAQRLSDYRANLSVNERLLHGLIHVGVAAYCYPTAVSLAEEDVRVCSVAAVERFLRDAATRLREQHGDADPDADAPELEQAWRLYLRRQPARDTADGRAGPSTTSGMVKYALERLAEQGMLVRLSDAEGGTYRALHRYRVAVRELAATQAYRTLAAATADRGFAAAGAAGG